MVYLNKSRPPILEDGILPAEPRPSSAGLDFAPDSEFEPPAPVSTRAAPAAAPKLVTSMRLTPAQEARLVDHAVQRISEVKREMGLDFNGYVEEGSWMGQRKQNQACYDNDYSWRVKLGGIFAKSNLSLGTNTRHVRTLAARVQDDLLGTSPFCAAIGTNPDKQTLAKQVEEEIQKKIDQSSVRKSLRNAQKIALIVNECVVKTTYHVESTTFKGPAEVMVSGFGEPILTPDKGLLIYKDDDFLPHPMVEELVMLEKDPSFTMKPGEFQIKKFEDLEQTATIYEGVKSEPIDYSCFLCPLRVPTVHDADINVHLYMRERGKVAQMYGGIDVGDRYFASGEGELTGDQTPRHVHGELEEYVTSIVPRISIAETYIRFDADQDGRDEEILLVLDTATRKPIFYDYLANHMKTRPFGVIVGLESVNNSWFGRGVYSLGEDSDLHIDAEFNRAQVKGSRSSSVTFRQKNAVEEWTNGVPMVIGTDDVYDLQPGYDPKNNPPIFKINLAEENSDALELMEISRQASDALIGAISQKDAQLTGMASADTATGVLNMQATADVIVKATEQEQTDGITAILGQVVTCILEHMDKVRLLFNKNATELVLLNREECRALSLDVKLLLTRSKSTQLLTSSKEALLIAKDYSMIMVQDPRMAQRLRPLYIAQLRGLEAAESDELCPDITDQMIAQFDAMQQQAAMIEQQNAQAEQNAKAAKLTNGSNGAN